MDLFTHNDSVALMKRKLLDFQDLFGVDNIRIYEDYYLVFSHRDQQWLFSALHYELNELLRYLFAKHLGNHHYNANESRKLLAIIQMLGSLKMNLKNTEFEFELDPSYDELLKKCKTFIRPTNGSPIPDDLEEIELIDHRNIFHLKHSVSVPNNPSRAYPLIFVGEGSYAQVFKYRDESYDLWIAQKRALNNLTAADLTRLRNEFDDLKKLDSPFIIQAFEYDNQNHSYTMEFVPLTLDKYIFKWNDRLSIIARIQLITQLFRAFSYIHHEGLLHRDISYTNILIKKHTDGSVFLKVADFGLAKHPHIRLTRPGTEFKGSLNDSNLRIIGFENYEVRHEVFALAFIICYILTGKKELSAIKDESVYEFFETATSPDLNRRFNTVNEMAQSFRRITPRIQELSSRKL
ncbi:protein kinase domain-containing protein [Paenibacillus sp. FSL K6-2524]|uniref:protein kinase domain-containing protein n=1 Tax=Paenibacillus sp. FSL K6-2524 TaxID=2954516 RepID=UPI0030F4E35B